MHAEDARQAMSFSASCWGADQGLEEGRFAEPEYGLDLGGMAPKVEQRLLERVVCVGEGEEAVQEMVCGGTGAGGMEGGVGLLEEEELGVDLVEVVPERGAHDGEGDRVES